MGALRAAPWPQKVDMRSLVTDGVAEKRFEDGTSNYYPLLNRLKKNGSLLGYLRWFGGSEGGPHGPRWSVCVFRSQMR